MNNAPAPLSTRDSWLGLLYAAKIILALLSALLLLGFASHWDYFPNRVHLATAGLVLGVCIPDALVLFSASTDKGESHLRVRIAAYLLELAAAVGCIAASLHVINGGGHGGEVGLLPGAFGVMLLFLAQANLVPFKSEIPKL